MPKTDTTKMYMARGRKAAIVMPVQIFKEMELRYDSKMKWKIHLTKDGTKVIVLSPLMQKESLNEA